MHSSIIRPPTAQHPLTRLPAFRHQNLLIEFASLKHASPRGIYLSLTPNNATLWHGIFFVQKGSYTGALLRFTLSFPPTYPSTPSSLLLNTRVFHPLVSPTTGLFSHPGLPATDVLEVLERFKAAFENEDIVLEKVRDKEVSDEVAWRMWNEEGRRRWGREVDRFVRASLEKVIGDGMRGMRGDGGDGEEGEVIRFGELLEREDVEDLVEEARRGLRERGVEVREF